MYLGADIPVIPYAVQVCNLKLPLVKRQRSLAKMQWKALALALIVKHGCGQGFPVPEGIPAMLRFQCSQLVIERLDPLVSPGLIPSPHLHQIVGGNSFNATMDPVDHDLVEKSTCTSCTFTEDLSNYWTAVLYFRARNGTYKRVPQLPNLGLGGNGGITGRRF
jgi:uncharacterized protein YbaR (Trm112 family)